MGTIIDQLMVNTKKFDNNMAATTKRQVLTTIASLFDPLEYLTSATVKMRLFLQNLWIRENGWDDHLKNEAENYSRNEGIIYHFCTETYWR